MNRINSRRWGRFCHQADIGIRPIGETIEEAFEEAASALTAVVTDPNLLEPKKFVKIVREAPADDLLLMDWLNAILHERASRRMLFCRFQVDIDRDGWKEPCGTRRSTSVNTKTRLR